MKKSALLILTIIFTGMLLVGCSFGATSTIGNQYKVAVLIGDMSSAYATWMYQSFQKLSPNYPQLELTYLDCKQDTAVQIANLENCVTKKFDYIIVQTVDVTQVAEAINEVMRSGIPVCIVNGSNPGMEDASSVDCDPVQQGAVPATEALNDIPQNANVVVLLGPAGNVHTIGRREGWGKTFFAARPDVNILDEQIGEWSKDKAMSLMENWIIKYGDEIDAVVSMNDSMALGCIEAAKAAGKKGILYYGVDGLGDACLSIKAGELTATCVQNGFDQASQSLIICARVLAGKIEREDYMSPAELIDASNVDKWIEVHKESGQIQ
jgi:inositol transport system substrate-binding protein